MTRYPGNGAHKITVIRTDGAKVFVRCDSVWVSDGVLYLNQPRYPAGDQPHLRIPLCVIQEWTEDND